MSSRILAIRTKMLQLSMRRCVETLSTENQFRSRTHRAKKSRCHLW
ncbi:hypothetical protein OSTOST_13751 [Ostertagia ostertagi]